MACSVCHRDIRIAAKGLCGACYQRLQKRGTTDYAPVRVRGACSVNDCDRPHAARGLCDLHHQRLLSTGNPETTKRPDDWGAKSKHPLYHRWSHIMRHRARYPVAEEWCDFLRFAMDIGTPPRPAAKIFAADATKPIGPENFVWKQSITERAQGEDERTYKARIQKVYRRVYAERHQSYELKKNYGISNDEKARMLEAQQGKCAICGCDETMSIKGRRVGLAVDHCHGSGKVRGLLCYQCNTGLGAFKDDAALLDAAKDYLARNYFAHSEAQE